MIDVTKVTDVVIAGIDMSDYPKFCDAYIESAKINGVEATEDECAELTDNGEFFYEKINEELF